MKKIILLLVAVLLFGLSWTTYAEEEFTSGDYKYILLDDGTAEITDYKGSEADLIIPEMIDGYVVTSIGNEAFSWCYHLKSIRVPESVTKIGINPFRFRNSLEQIIVSADHPVLEVIDGLLYYKPEKKLVYCPLNKQQVEIPQGIQIIGDYAFECCASLNSITFPDSLKNIGDDAFSNCYRLSSIILPEGLTSIGNTAFVACNSLRSITLPDSLTEIGTNPFMGCGFLDRIVLSADHPVLEVIDGLLYNKKEKKLIFCPWQKLQVEIPNGIRIIEKFSFSNCSNINSINLPESLVSIDGYAFFDCHSLSSINLPESVTSIGECAFHDCPNLTITVTKDSYAEGYCKENGLNYIYTGEEEPITPDYEDILYEVGTVEITKYTGSEADLTVPEMIYVPGSYSGKQPGIGGGVVEVTVTVDENEITAIKIDGHEETPNIGGAAINQLADQILEAQSAQIDGVSGATVTSIAVSNALTLALEKAMIEDSQEAGTPTLKPTATPTPEPILTTEDEVSQSSIEYVLHEDGTAEITDYKGDEADLIVPDKIDGYVVTSIGNNAFSYCDSLISITLPESVTNIGEDAFNSCRNLRNITLPEGLISIGRWAFFCCESLTSLTLPDSVTEIGGNPFGGCISLEQVDVSGKHPVLAVIEGLLYYKPEKRLVYCPLQKQHVEIPKGIQIIGDWAFVNCTNLSSITLPESLLTIGDGVFFNCTSLNSINFPESVTSIGDWAFYDSSDLTITVSRDSYAEKYCEENEMDYVYTDSLDWLE